MTDHDPFSPMACCGRERDASGGPNPHCECPAELKPRSFPVTDPEIDAPDGAVVDGYERHGDRWVALPARGKCPSCLELAEHAETDLKCTCVPPLDIEGWTAEERDAYYSRLPGDDRLVAGLDPLPATPEKLCPDCALPLAAERKTKGARVDLMSCGARFSTYYELQCKRCAVHRLRSELSTLRELDQHREEAARLLRSVTDIVFLDNGGRDWPAFCAWVDAEAARQAKAKL